MEIDFEVRDLHRCSGQCGMGGAHERLSDQGVLLRLQRPKYVQKGAPISCFGDREFNIVDGEIVEVKPQERLVTTFQAHWDEKVSKDKPSRVAWELTPRGESSKVTLVDDRFDSETATYKQSPDGWNIILSTLKTFLETGKPVLLDQST